MEFKKRKEFSIDKESFLFQISHDEFVHANFDGKPKVITWMKGKNRVEQQSEYDNICGIVDNALFYYKGNMIKKAQLINDKIVIADCVKIDTRFCVRYNSDHYFVERDNNPNAVFAIPLNKDYRSTNGRKFNISIDDIQKFFQVHILGKYLFRITILTNCSSICRYESDSEIFLVKGELPKIGGRSLVFNNWIFYMTKESDLVSVNMIDFSWEILKTKLDEKKVSVNISDLSWEMKKEKFDESRIVGINEKGIMNVQTNPKKAPIHLFSAQLHEKYLVKTNRKLSEFQIIDPNKKKRGELQNKNEELVMNNEFEKNDKELKKIREELMRTDIKKTQEERLEEKEKLLKDKEELLKNKGELLQRIAALECAQKVQQEKYNKLLIKDSEHNATK